MSLIHTESLACTIDEINRSVFFGQKVRKADALAAGRFIAGRLGLARAYAGTFALFDNEMKNGVRAFTGERLTGASACHIIAQESCRALRLLAVDDAAVQRALEEATERLKHRVGPVNVRKSAHHLSSFAGGTYCCGRCSVGLWRHLAVGGMDEHHRRFSRGMACLKSHRTDEGGWRIFPFWYAVSALVEIDLPAARQEIKHSALRLQRALRSKLLGEFAERRRALAQRALESL